MSSEYPIVTKKHNYKRIIAISAIVLIGIPLMFFSLIVGSQLFARAEDKIPHDVISKDITKSSASITWITDQNTQGVIEYGNDPDALNFYAPEESPRKEHSVELTMLSSSTTYYFQIRVGDSTYDNGGMPWSFTTKTETGEEVKEQVRGISTRISKISDKDITPTSKPVCDVTTCSEIQKKLGKGCAVSDYVKCMSVQTTQSSNQSLTPTITGTIPSITPGPTSILIKSNKCELNYLQSVNSCAKWSWGESFDVQERACTKSFYKYVLQCKRNDFSTAGGEIGEWSIYNIAETFYEIDPNRLLNNDTVYCRVRVEDKDGNATEWHNNKEPKKCT